MPMSPPAWALFHGVAPAQKDLRMENAEPERGDVEAYSKCYSTTSVIQYHVSINPRWNNEVSLNMATGSCVYSDLI